jgi:Domain of unknown function (DUF4157)
MRLPWRGRSGPPAAPPAPAPVAPPARAWNQVPPLRAAVSVTPPLVGGAGEHSGAIRNRLRSTSVLVHRPRVAAAPIVPEVSGTMSGISTVASSTVFDTPAYPPVATARVNDDSLTRELPSTLPRAVPARATQDPLPSLTAIDAASAAALMPVRRALRDPSPAPVAAGPVDVENEPEPPKRPFVMPAAVPGRTVVRHREQGGAPRPVGLQAPLEHVPAPTRGAERSVERVPERVAAAVQQAHGADVRQMHVVRGDAASKLASSVQARAVTRDGEVFLPPERGPLDTPANRGLLAHELTHVLQQRRLGAEVPLEHTPAGRALEAHAEATERAVRGDAGSALPAAETSASSQSRQQPEASVDTVRAVQDELTASGFATRAADGSLVFATPSTPGLQTGVAVQRAPESPAPGGAPEGTPGSAASPSDGAGSPVPRSAPSSSFPSALVVTQSSPAAAATPGTTTQPGPMAQTSTVVAQAPEPASAPADAEQPDADLMARRLYDRLAARLRTELILDRERAGLLTDLR